MAGVEVADMEVTGTEAAGTEMAGSSSTSCLALFFPLEPVIKFIIVPYKRIHTY